MEESETNEPAPTNQPNEFGTNDASSNDTSIDKDLEPTWIFFVDGSSNEQDSGAGIVLINPSRLKLEKSIRFGFLASNNEAEYKALLAGLKLAIAVDADRIMVWSDSQLVVNQIKGEYATKDKKMTAYLGKVKEMFKDFAYFKIQQLSRCANRQVDALANLGPKQRKNCAENFWWNS